MTFEDAKRVAGQRKGERLHVVGTLAKDASKSLFEGTPLITLEGRSSCNVELTFAEEGQDAALKMKKGQRLSAVCKYDDGSDKRVSLKQCHLAAPPDTTEATQFSWDSIVMPETPSALAGKPQAEIERLYRAVTVAIWNQQITMGRDHARVYKSLAERLSVHVDVIQAAHQFVGAQQQALAHALRQRLDPIPDLAPDYYHPVAATAFAGSFTVTATIILDACPDEDAQDKGLAAVKRLIGLLPPQASGLRVPRVKYKCSKLGTDGVLDFGFIWRPGDAEPKQMPECSGTYQ